MWDRARAQTPQCAWSSVQREHSPAASYLSIWDMKRVSKVPRVLSFSEASPLKSRFSSTSFSSTSRTISPMYFPPMIFSYLGGGIGEGAASELGFEGPQPAAPPLSFPPLLEVFPRVGTAQGEGCPCWELSPARHRGWEACPEELDLSYSLQLLTGVK